MSGSPVASAEPRLGAAPDEIARIVLFMRRCSMEATRPSRADAQLLREVLPAGTEIFPERRPQASARRGRARGARHPPRRPRARSASCGARLRGRKGGGRAPREAQRRGRRARGAADRRRFRLSPLGETLARRGNSSTAACCGRPASSGSA